MGFLSKEVLAALSIRLGLDSTSLSDGVKSIDGQFNRLKKSVSSLAPQLAGVFAVAGIIKYSKEAAVLASQLEGVRHGFNKIADANMLDSLRRSTMGTVTQVELMKKAVLANNFQIALKELPKFFQFATLRAKETGESVDYMVDSIVRGIGRRSALVLDNIGISATALSSALEKSGTYAEAVGSIVNGEMGRYAGEWVKTSAQQFDTWGVKLVDIKTNLGGLLIDLGKYTGILQTNTRQYQGQVAEIQAMVGAILDLKEGTEARTKAMNELISAYPLFFYNLDAEKTKNDELRDSLSKTIDLYKQKIVLEQYADAASKVEKADAKLIKKYKQESDFIISLTRDYVNATASMKERISYINANSDYLPGLGDFFNGKQVTKTLEFFNKYDAAVESNKMKITSLKKEYSDLSVELFGFDVFEKKLTPDVTETLGIIETLKEQIAGLEKEFEGATKKADLSKIAEQLKPLKKELAEYMALLDDKKSDNGFLAYAEKQIEKLNEQLKNAKSITDSWNIKNKIESLKLSMQFFSGDGTDLKTGIDSDIQDVNDLVDSELLKLFDSVKYAEIEMQFIFDGKFVDKEIYDALDAQLKSIKTNIESAIEDAMSSFAESIGKGLAGNWEAGWYLEPIGDMLVTLGKMAIAAGITIESLKESLATFVGAPAIIAGVALVALGSAVKQSVSNLASNTSGSTASSVSSVATVDTYNTRNYGDRSSQSINVVVEGKISGSTIYLANQRYSKQKNLTT